MRKLNQQIFIVAMFVMAAVTISSCVGTKAAYRAAAESEDPLHNTAIVVSEHFNALQKEAVAIAESGVAQSWVDRMAAAEKAARPTVLDLRRLDEIYIAARTAETQAELQAALNSAALLVSKFFTEVKRR
jgi:hypothetical protein